MSKFIEKLNNLNKSAVPAMGFRKPIDADKSMSLLILVELSGRSEDEIKEIALAGVSAGVIDTSGLNAGALAKYVRSTGGMPLGLVLDSGKSGNGLKLASRDIDFIIYDEKMSVNSFEGKDLDSTGKVLKVDTGLEASLLRAVHNVFPNVNGVLIDISSSVLTIESLMICSRVVEFTGEPCIALINGSLSSSELISLREVGVKAVMLPLSATIDEIKDIVEKIAGLPRTEKRDERKRVALLPKMGMFPAAKSEDDNDNDEDS